MASITLLESAKLTQDMFLSGVIENVYTADRFFEVLPFMAITGNSLQYTRENALGDVQVATVGDTITAKAAASFTTVNTGLTKILGDAEVDNLIQATRSDDTDQTIAEVASKAKACGRKYREMLITGTGASNQFEGLRVLVASGQSIVQDTAAVETNGGPLSFAKLDELMDLVVDKDGDVDYLVMNSRTIRSFKSLLRALGGANIGEVITLPSGKKVPSYCEVPIFKNDWVPVNETTGSLTTGTSVYAGTLDTGSTGKVGLAGLTAQRNSGIQVVSVGESETKDEAITRIRWYCGLALFSEKGLARLSGVSN